MAKKKDGNHTTICFKKEITSITVVNAILKRANEEGVSFVSAG